VAVLYGGASMRQQISALRGGAQIVVGTPGRVMDLMNKNYLKINELSYFILDEADEMLNMGFLDDIEEILKSTNKDKKMLFFSATMPTQILKVAKTYMQEFEVVKVAAQQLTANNTEQIYFEVRERDKVEALTRIIDSEKEFYGIVFCRTKRECDDLTASLQSRGYTADAIHGDHEQRTRERVLKKFKAKKTLILVATDVAARGIDVNDLTHVVNYHIPQDPESYTHRIGRTGRAGNKGTAITLITPSEWRKIAFIQRKTNAEIEKQQLPSIDDVVENKKNHIRNHIGVTIDEDLKQYNDFVEELLTKHDHEDVIKALVKIAFGEQLDTNNYRDVRPVINNADAAGVTRLFIARGRSHGIT
jgi:ATP-dependent RNA helicase DeaD